MPAQARALPHRLRPGQRKQQEMGQPGLLAAAPRQEARHPVQPVPQVQWWDWGPAIGLGTARGLAGLRGTRQKKASGSTTPTGQPVILLSIFDGMGCAKLALDIVAEQTKVLHLGLPGVGDRSRLHRSDIQNARSPTPRGLHQGRRERSSPTDRPLTQNRRPSSSSALALHALTAPASPRDPAERNRRNQVRTLRNLAAATTTTAG